MKTITIKFTDTCVNDSMCHECMMKEKWEEPEPANQKPITPEQILSLNKKHGYFQYGDAQGATTLAFVRDIEEIHGIKLKKVNNANNLFKI